MTASVLIGTKIPPVATGITPGVLGTDYHEYAQNIDFQTFNWQQSVILRGDACTFSVLRYIGEDDAADQLGFTYVPIPRKGNEVRVEINGKVEYGGVVLRTRLRRHGQGWEEYILDCRDYSYHLDRRTIRFLRLGQIAPADTEALRLRPRSTGEYIYETLRNIRDLSRRDRDPADYDQFYERFVQQAVIFQNPTGAATWTPETEATYDPLADWDKNVGSVTSGQNVPTVPAGDTAQGELPSAVIDRLTRNAGYFWYVDYDKRVVFVPDVESVVPVPLPRLGDYDPTSIILCESDVPEGPEEPVIWLSASKDFPGTGDGGNWFEYEEEDDIERVATRVWLDNVRVTVEPSITEDHTIIGGLFITLDRQIANQNSITGLTVSYGVDDDTTPTDLRAVGYSIDPLPRGEGSRGESPPSNTVWVDVSHAATPGGQRDLPVLFFSPDIPKLNVGSVITVTYNPYEDEVVYHDELEFQEEIAELTGGDGVHEYNYSRISGLELTNDQDRFARARQLLERLQQPLLSGSFVSYAQTWRPGQSFVRIDDNEREARPPTRMWVTNVNKTIEATHTQYREGQPKGMISGVFYRERMGVRVKSEIEFSSVKGGLNA